MQTPIEKQPFEDVALDARCELKIAFIPEAELDGMNRPTALNPGRGHLHITLTAGKDQKVFQSKETFPFNRASIFRLFHAEANKGIDTLIEKTLGEGDQRPDGMIPVELPGPKIWTPKP
jgi:hypothetical protein